MTRGLIALDLECRLQIAMRLHCQCGPYLARRREALLPAVQREAESRGIDDLELLARYMNAVHERHEAGLPLDLPEPAMSG